MTQALILAAGRGSRLGAIINGQPKCMLRIGGQTLLAHQVSALRSAGIERICVVAGYGAEYVQQAIAGDCQCIVNDRFGQTNSLYSLWLARDAVHGPLVVVNGDVLADPRIYGLVADDPMRSRLAFDSSSGDQHEQMKVYFERGMLRAIAKDMRQNQTHGENVGIFQVSERATSRFFAAADYLVTHRGHHCWTPAALDRICPEFDIEGVDVAGRPWTEIDFPDDLAQATRAVWPAICDRSAAGPGEQQALPTVFTTMARGARLDAGSTTN